MDISACPCNSALHNAPRCKSLGTPVSPAARTGTFGANRSPCTAPCRAGSARRAVRRASHTPESSSSRLCCRPRRSSHCRRTYRQLYKKHAPMSAEEPMGKERTGSPWRARRTRPFRRRMSAAGESPLTAAARAAGGDSLRDKHTRRTLGRAKENVADLPRPTDAATTKREARIRNKRAVDRASAAQAASERAEANKHRVHNSGSSARASFRPPTRAKDGAKAGCADFPVEAVRVDDFVLCSARLVLPRELDALIWHDVKRAGEEDEVPSSANVWLVLPLSSLCPGLRRLGQRDS